MKSAFQRLTPRHAKFVTEYLSHGDGTRAARAAGYSPGNARTQASMLIREHKDVRAAIEEARAEYAKKAGYTLAVAMAETVEGLEFARTTKNANAFVKVVELRAKLNGLLVEKRDVSQSGFVLNIHGFEKVTAKAPEQGSQVENQKRIQLELGRKGED